MSTYIDGTVVHLNDVNGFHASIPVREVHRLRDEANDSDDGIATYSIRVIGRDVLNGAVDLLDNRERCTFTSPAGDCDQHAVFDLAHSRPRCADHPKD